MNSRTSAIFEVKNTDVCEDVYIIKKYLTRVQDVLGLLNCFCHETVIAYVEKFNILG